ncbi:hypothetical protein DAPPUDRAFT_325139 [Daphnia pulex]|uniref:Uncharacterized protein n=1 Tax=Daphnia pulex TaxID=6669 RepID=E9H3U5_DAPPU|nr:hypothetical protein DAPPUDRAFT_325139 [Daphnia pulex]|eukprot:EFX73653.1 hypothetical protein DAPPUDRAFT_325139 [Daphnia pulex]
MSRSIIILVMSLCVLLAIWVGVAEAAPRQKRQYYGNQYGGYNSYGNYDSYGGYDNYGGYNSYGGYNQGYGGGYGGGSDEIY